MKKALISVTGLDTTGIIARVATKLYEMNINILDITQTILQDYFNMMMIVDVSRMEKTFDEMAKELAAVGEQKGVQVLCQREEIFTSMHRL